MEEYLKEAAGPTVTVSPQPSDGQACIEQLAAELAIYIDPLLQSGHPINLVGFSMGGLICRYYWQFLACNSNVERLITIATPHHGTWSAFFTLCPACIQMRPGSRFLQKLNQDLTALQELKFTSVWTPFDLTIIPSISSWLPVGEIVTVASPFHHTMVSDPRLLQALSARLVC